MADSQLWLRHASYRLPLKFNQVDKGKGMTNDDKYMESAFLLPDLIEIQRSSFCWFLAKGLPEELEKLSSISNDFRLLELNIFGQQYKIKRPKYSQTDSRRKNITHSIKI